MKFIISTQELNYLLAKILSVVPSKPAAPILGNFLLKAQGGSLILSATDLMVGIQCVTEAKILEEGFTTLPIKKFASLIREITVANVEISTNPDHITTIIAGPSRFKLNGMMGEAYPSLPDLEGSVKFTLEKKIFREMFFKTAFVAPKEDNRYALMGVLLQIANGQATFTATDGKRLARTHTSIAISTDYKGQCVIPNKAVDEFLKNIPDEDGSLTIFLLPDRIGVECDGCLIITKLLAGEYPDVDQVIPEHSSTVINLHREELASLIRQVSLFLNDASVQPVEFAFDTGGLEISANTAEIGEGRVSMPVNYYGPKMKIALNPKFLRDILEHSKEEVVTAGFTDAFNPIVMTEKEFSVQPNPLFILMPMRRPEIEGAKT